MITTKVYANMLAVTHGKRLDCERLRRVVEAKSVAEAFKMLGDYGFVYTDGMTVDGFIVGETDRLISFIEETSSSDLIISALTARFVYNNVKLAYKSRFVPVSSDKYYNTSLEVKKVTDGDYEGLDKTMAAALVKLDENNETRPQAIDIELTRAMYKSVLACPIPIIKKYFRAEIDMKNILTAARMRRLSLEGDEFIDGGKIKREALEGAVRAEEFAECFARTPYYEYAQKIEEGDFKDLWKAELDSDDYLYYLTDDEVTSFSSYKPFLNYYTEALIELKTVKTALVCVKTDGRDVFYARIPQIYK